MFLNRVFNHESVSLVFSIFAFAISAVSTVNGRALIDKLKNGLTDSRPPVIVLFLISDIHKGVVLP